jgi:hypothetical protein
VNSDTAWSRRTNGIRQRHPNSIREVGRRRYADPDDPEPIGYARASTAGQKLALQCDAVECAVFLLAIRSVKTGDT